MKFTVFGGRGFVGGSLVTYLTGQGHEVFIPSRSGEDAVGQDLGNVVYAIGMTANFRGRPFETVEAHVSVLARLLRHARFDSWLYLSSTRLYSRIEPGMLAQEDMSISVEPGADSLYDISKLMGEALCLSQSSPQVRVVRLSNVYGVGQSPHTFLACVIGELIERGKVAISESPASAKDYIAVSDVVALLEKIALHGRERIYNVASGISVTHADLADRLFQLTGCDVTFSENPPTRTFPEISVTRILDEFGFVPMPFLDNLGATLGDSIKTKRGIIL